jgi:4-hydroxyphenylpyruvate dioxygenase-like putative hemolysin
MLTEPALQQHKLAANHRRSKWTMRIKITELERQIAAIKSIGGKYIYLAKAAKIITAKQKKRDA